jgi:hypothetical protein
LYAFGRKLTACTSNKNFSPTSPWCTSFFMWIYSFLLLSSACLTYPYNSYIFKSPDILSYSVTAFL